MVLVATSNQPPRQLYAEGFNRERFQPEIAVIERHMRVIAIDGGRDHRLHPGAAQPRDRVARPEQLSGLPEQFSPLSEDLPVSTVRIVAGHRFIAPVQLSPAVLWCRYAELCEVPTLSA